MSSHANAGQAVATLDADRRQAKYFHDELHHQIELLNEQAEIFKTALATCLRRNELRHVRRIQHELRGNALERTRLIDMLSALNHRFGRDETETRPMSSPRHRTPAAPRSTSYPEGEPLPRRRGEPDSSTTTQRMVIRGPGQHARSERTHQQEDRPQAGTTGSGSALEAHDAD